MSYNNLSMQEKKRKAEEWQAMDVLKEDFWVLWEDSRRRQCWHSVEQEGPRLKDTRTNNQRQILFNHHLSGPNYPKKLHKEHHYHSALVHTVCVRARVLHLFIEERFISGLAVYLFLTNRHCCEILWVHFTNTTRHFSQFFPPASRQRSPNPSPPLTHTLHLLLAWEYLSLLLSFSLGLAHVYSGVNSSQKSFIWCNAVCSVVPRFR